MPRKVEVSSPTGSAAPRTTGASLRNLRAQIDKLDLQILDLVNKRAGVAAEIGKLKNEHGEEVFSPAREEEVLQNVLQVNEKNKGPLDQATVPLAVMVSGASPVLWTSTGTFDSMVIAGAVITRLTGQSSMAAPSLARQ